MQFEFWTIIGVVLTAYVAFKFFMQLGKSLPILELMLLIAGLQWIIGPFIEYSFPSYHFKYYMYVDQNTYMSYVVPSYLVFVLSVMFVKRSTSKIQVNVEYLKNYKSYGLFVFLIGVVFDVLLPFLPGALGFFAFILSNFKYAGAIILYFSEDKRMRQIFFGSIIYLLGVSIRFALFHEFVLWAVFFFMIWSVKNKPTKGVIIAAVAIGLFSLTTLQTIKSVYRSKVWNGYGGNKIELFATLFIDVILSNPDLDEDLDGDENNIRLNQGWIISALMDQVPNKVGYSGGSTVIEAVLASIFPRFLNPNKKKAGGDENFERFTGLELGDNTSMGISIVGEAYINFGVIGGVFFMLIWGIFISKVWVWLIKKTTDNVLLLAFLPLIFLQVVKAETELVVVLNHLVKSMIVVFGFFWAVKRFLNWQIRIETSD